MFKPSMALIFRATLVSQWQVCKLVPNRLLLYMYVCYIESHDTIPDTG